MIYTFQVFFKHLFIIYKYTVAIFRHTRRGHQISLQMVMSHHVTADIGLRTSRRAVLLTALSSHLSSPTCNVKITKLLHVIHQPLFSTAYLKIPQDCVHTHHYKTNIWLWKYTCVSINKVVEKHLIHPICALITFYLNIVQYLFSNSQYIGYKVDPLMF